MSEQTLTILKAFEKVEEWYYDIVYENVHETVAHLLPAIELCFCYGTALVSYGDRVLFNSDDNNCYFEGELEGSEYPWGVEEYYNAILDKLKVHISLVSLLHNSFKKQNKE